MPDEPGTAADTIDSSLENAPRVPRVLDQHPRTYMRLGFYTALGVVLLGVVVSLAYRVGAAFADVAAPFVAGTFLALLLDPLADRLERKGLNRFLAIGIVCIAFVGIIVGLGCLIVPKLVDQGGKFAAQVPSYIASLRVSMDTFLLRHHTLAGVRLPKNSGTLFNEISDRITATIQGSAGNLTDILRGSATTVFQAVVSLLIMFYLLADIHKLRARVFFLVPAQYRRSVYLVTDDIGNVFSDYIRGLISVCSLYGMSVIIVLYLLALVWHPLVGFALLVGISAGILYSIPYIGALSIALIVFLVGSAAGGATGGFIILACVLAVNFTFDNVINPRVVGGGVGLHPVAAILALAMGGRLFGFWGLLLSVPIAGSVQAVLFRIFPRLTEPTPEAFLRRGGVMPHEAPPLKVTAVPTDGAGE